MDEEQLSAGEVKRRAAAGVVVLGLRGIAIRLVQTVAIVLLARLLTPEDFGLVAFGTIFVGIGALAVDSGLGATLIRRHEPVERADLSALLAFQLAVSFAVFVAVALGAIPFGKGGEVTTVMVATLPVIALRAPGVVVLERRLEYGPIFYAELAETVVYYGLALGGAKVGWGVWALAGAMVPRSIAGSAVILGAAREARVLPRLAWTRLHGMLGFGLRTQAVGLINTLRDQGVNAGVAAIGGVAVLGVWSFAYRILQLPFILFGALWRVSFPAMSRLSAAGEELGPVVERVIRVASVATGAVLAPLVAATPSLVPIVLGSKWHDVVDVVPWPALGLMISGPISVAAAGYLYAMGDAGTPLRATVWHTVAWFVVAFPLLPALGATAVGIGWLASNLVDAVVLGKGAARRSGASVAAPLLVPTVLALCGAGLGWVISSAGTATLWRAVVAAVTALTIYLGGLLLVRRSALLELWTTAGRMFRGSAAKA